MGKKKPDKPETEPKTPIAVQDLLLDGAYVLTALNIGQGFIEGHQSTDAIAKSLEAGVARLRVGDLSVVEEILFVQVQLLHSLTNRWMMNALNSSQSDALKTFAGLALKSQEQARKTSQVIGELKNPKPTQFVKNKLNQLNVNPPIEGNTHAQMDAGSSPTRSGALPSEPALEAVYRTQD